MTTLFKIKSLSYTLRQNGYIASDIYTTYASNFKPE